MRLASWIRFETFMASTDWEGAIGLLVANIHQSDQELLRLLRLCVPGQQIASMEEAQALLLRNFRVGKDDDSECANWLTDMARDMLAPIPFREVFVILALFLPNSPLWKESKRKSTFGPAQPPRSKKYMSTLRPRQPV